MDILLAVLFSAALQTSLPGADASRESTASRGVTAPFQRPCGDETSGVGPHGAERLGLAGSDSNGNGEDLLFYLSSHALVAIDLSEALWMPWLELRTLAPRAQGIASETSRKAALSVGAANVTCGVNITGNDARRLRSSPRDGHGVMRSKQVGQSVAIN